MDLTLLLMFLGTGAHTRIHTFVYITIDVCTYMCIILYMYSGTSLLQTPLGPHEVSRLKRCPYFRRHFVHSSMYIAGTTGSVLIREVSLFQWSLIGRFHCRHDVGCCLAIKFSIGKLQATSGVWVIITMKGSWANNMHLMHPN